MKRKHGILWALLTVAVMTLTACSMVEGTPAPDAPAPAEPSEPMPGQASGLENRPWRLTSYVNAQAETVEAAAHSPAVVSFEDGSVGGSSGCNSFFGSYTLRGNGISIGEMGSTLMACEETLMQQEQDFLAALAGAATYAVEGETLQLFDANGAVVATFTLQVEQESTATLTGVQWSAEALGGAGVVSSLIAGTEILANFGDDGILIGNAGCNRYSAPFTADGDALRVGAAVVTRILCSAPEGIMEQEQEYLAALEAVSAYRIEGDMLELVDANGEMVVAFKVWDETETEEAAAAAAACAEPVLGNLTYQIPGAFDEAIHLTACEYKDASAKASAKLLPAHIGRGEIGGTPSVAAMLFVQPDEYGSQYYLALVQEVDGQSVHVASYLLGSRVMAKSIAIEDERIVVDMLTQGPGSASCCSFTHLRNAYDFRDGRIVQVSSVDMTGQ